MDAKTRAIFREIMREIGERGQDRRQALPCDHDAGGAVGACQEGSHGCGEEADGRKAGE
jgi:hypothetical protein